MCGCTHVKYYNKFICHLSLIHLTDKNANSTQKETTSVFFFFFLDTPLLFTRSHLLAVGQCMNHYVSTAQNLCYIFIQSWHRRTYYNDKKINMEPKWRMMSECMDWHSSFSLLNGQISRRLLFNHLWQWISIYTFFLFLSLLSYYVHFFHLTASPFPPQSVVEGVFCSTRQNKKNLLALWQATYAAFHFKVGR